MDGGWRRGGEAMSDYYRAWVAGDGPTARLVDEARRRALRLLARVAAELGLPFPWSEPMLSRADLSEVRLLLRKPGCPACRHRAEACARSLFWFLMEGYGESAWIDALLKAGGFCPRHMWQVADSGLAYRISYVVQYLTRDLHRRLVTLGVPAARGDRAVARERCAVISTERCPLCVSLDSDVRRQIQRIVLCLRDAELSALYAGSDGFCWPHFELATARAEGPVLRVLAETQRARLADAERLLGTECGDPTLTGRQPSAHATALLSGWRFGPTFQRRQAEWVELAVG